MAPVPRPVADAAGESADASADMEGCFLVFDLIISLSNDLLLLWLWLLLLLLLLQFLFVFQCSSELPPSGSL